jgi:competence protein ComEA
LLDLFVVIPAVVTAPASPPALAATVTVRETLTAAAAVGDRVNINTADVKELMTLSGVGQKVAERIVEYREAHGPFKKPEDLRKVEGIGGGLWERNRERIVIK